MFFLALNTCTKLGPELDLRSLLITSQYKKAPNKQTNKQTNKQKTFSSCLAFQGMIPLLINYTEARNLYGLSWKLKQNSTIYPPRGCSQATMPRFRFLMHWSFEINTEIESAHAMKLNKLLTMRPRYQNSRDMKFTAQTDYILIFV